MADTTDDGVSSMNASIEKAYVYVVRKRGDDWFLLAFESHDEPGWEVPKGAAEGSESPEETAYRELLEEAGLGEAVLSCPHHIGTHRWFDETQRFFVMELQGSAPSEFRHQVTGNGQDAGFTYHFRWLPVNDHLAEHLVQGSDAFVEALLAHLHGGQRQCSRPAPLSPGR